MNDDTGSDITPRQPFSPTVELALAQSNQAQVQAEGIIKGHMIGAMSVGLIPFPMIDVVALIDIQWNLICRLADHYGVPIQQAYKAVLISTIGGSLPVLLAGFGCSLLKLIPGFGQIACTVALSNIGAAFTYATGKVFMAHFESGGTMVDFRANTFGHQFRLEFRRGKRAAEQMRPGLQT
jgi:uncharacterized protein (DUF697 family)